MKRIFAALCALLLSCQISPALTEMNSESSFAVQMELAFHSFAEEHSGNPPTSWADLQPYFSKPIDRIVTDILPTKRYAFLSKPVPLTGPYDGNMLFIARKPIPDNTSRKNWFRGRSSVLGEPVRYMIYRKTDGGFMRAKLPEVYVQRVFKDTGSVLPEPDNEPERQYVLQFRRNKIALWSIAGIGMVTILSFTYMRKRRRTSLFGS